MYCIGLMSGTSVDGIDAALVDITGTEMDLQVQLLAGETYPYPPQLRQTILAVCGGASLSMAELAELDDGIATQFAIAAETIQTETGNIAVQLIGSHGQTVFHRPASKEKGTLGYSLQLGRGEVIATLTGIPTVSNFRVADIAAGGQGAPLVSKVDAYLLSHPTLYRCIQNIGGIGNLTYLPARQQSNWEQAICGWDTGPGNALLDLAVRWLTDGQQTYDKDGNWAA
ncbi:MAG: anhydro-N-acetylmuramic acid kinase, partial [Microcystaceae cyanobacterium]